MKLVVQLVLFHERQDENAPAQQRLILLIELGHGWKLVESGLVIVQGYANVPEVVRALVDLSRQCLLGV